MGRSLCPGHQQQVSETATNESVQVGHRLETTSGQLHRTATLSPVHVPEHLGVPTHDLSSEGKCASMLVAVQRLSGQVSTMERVGDIRRPTMRMSQESAELTKPLDECHMDDPLLKFIMSEDSNWMQHGGVSSWGEICGHLKNISSACVQKFNQLWFNTAKVEERCVDACHSEIFSEVWDEDAYVGLTTTAEAEDLCENLYKLACRISFAFT